MSATEQKSGVGFYKIDQYLRSLPDIESEEKSGKPIQIIEKLRPELIFASRRGTSLTPEGSEIQGILNTHYYMTRIHPKLPEKKRMSEEMEIATLEEIATRCGNVGNNLALDRNRLDHYRHQFRAISLGRQLLERSVYDRKPFKNKGPAYKYPLTGR